MSQENGATGFNGLINSTGGASDNFQYHGGVMIWSFGPDKKADQNQKASVARNKDNILSWK
jgi:hypothetical protein